MTCCHKRLNLSMHKVDLGAYASFVQTRPDSARLTVQPLCHHGLNLTYCVPGTVPSYQSASSSAATSAADGRYLSSGEARSAGALRAASDSSAFPVSALPRMWQLVRSLCGLYQRPQPQEPGSVSRLTRAQAPAPAPVPAPAPALARAPAPASALTPGVSLNKGSGTQSSQSPKSSSERTITGDKARQCVRSLTVPADSGSAHSVHSHCAQRVSAGRGGAAAAAARSSVLKAMELCGAAHGKTAAHKAILQATSCELMGLAKYGLSKEAQPHALSRSARTRQSRMHSARAAACIRDFIHATTPDSAAAIKSGKADDSMAALKAARSGMCSAHVPGAENVQ